MFKFNCKHMKHFWLNQICFAEKGSKIVFASRLPHCCKRRKIVNVLRMTQTKDTVNDFFSK